MNRVFDLIQDRVQRKLSTQQVGTSIAIFIAGPIDEDYDPDIENHHWEIATLVDVEVLGLSIDLNCCEIIDADEKEIDDCHGWLSLDTDGREHTLGVLIVAYSPTANVWTPFSTNTLGNGQYLPFAVTFIGRNRDDDEYKNIITQWHEELLKFVFNGQPTL